MREKQSFMESTVFYVGCVFGVGLCVGAVIGVISGGWETESMKKDVAFKTIKLLHAEVRHLKQQIGPVPKADTFDDDADHSSDGSHADPDLPIALRTIRLLQWEVQRLRVAHITKHGSPGEQRNTAATTTTVEPPPPPSSNAAASGKGGEMVSLEGSARLAPGSLQYAKDAKDLSQSLAAYIKKAMPTEEELPREKWPLEQEGDQDPVSASGRVLWALAMHPEINNIVSYYSGAAVYCIARGLAHKHRKTNVKGKVYSTEVNHMEYQKLQELLKKEGLSDYVEVKDGGVHGPDPPICKGAIDLFVEDITGGEPMLVMDKVLTSCSPTYYFSENTGGIGANHAYKHDYQDTIPEDHIVIKDRLSMLSGGKCGAGCGGLQGRRFSLYARPMPYDKVTHFQYPRDGLLVFYANGPGLDHPKDQPQYRRRSGRDGQR